MAVASFYTEIKGYVRGVKTDSEYTITAVMLCMSKVLKEAQIHCNGCNAIYHALSSFPVFSLVLKRVVTKIQFNAENFLTNLNIVTTRWSPSGL